MAGWRGFVSGANFSVRRVCWLRRGRCVPPEMLLMSFLQNGFQPLHSICCGGLVMIYLLFSSFRCAMWYVSVCKLSVRWTLTTSMSSGWVRSVGAKFHTARMPHA